MRRTGGRSGNALFVALALLVIVASFGAALHANSRRLTVSNLALRQDAATRWAAEGAIEAARAALARSADHVGGAVEIGGLDVAVTVSPIEGRPDARLIVAIATGDPAGPSARRGRAQVEAIVRLGAALPTVESWVER